MVELGSLHLQGLYFTYWAVSPAQQAFIVPLLCGRSLISLDNTEAKETDRTPPRETHDAMSDSLSIHSTDLGLKKLSLIRVIHVYTLNFLNVALNIQDLYCYWTRAPMLNCEQIGCPCTNGDTFPASGGVLCCQTVGSASPIER